MITYNETNFLWKESLNKETCKLFYKKSLCKKINFLKKVKSKTKEKVKAKSNYML